jgi:hypothetical protein
MERCGHAQHLLNNVVNVHITKKKEPGMSTKHLGNFSSVLGAAHRWMRTKPIIPAALLGVAVFWLFGPARSAGQSVAPLRTLRGSSDAAIERFWTVYHANDYGAIPGVQAELHAALNRDPENATLYRCSARPTSGTSASNARDPKPDSSVLQQDMPLAVQLFQKALDLDYNGRHLRY